MADWQPNTTQVTLQGRAGMLACIRAFMAERGILEVETPILSRAGNPDPNIHSLTTTTGLTELRQYYLNTSPEFAMKRLLAAGSGSIYQITRAFRNDAASRLHQPEFTMLEWYRPDYDHHMLMDELATLLHALELGQCRRLAYAEVFRTYIELDPHSAGLAALADKATSLGLVGAAQDRALLLDFLFNYSVSPHLGLEAPLFLYDYPACQAALARLSTGRPQVAERFELFISGMEIANGFHELADAAEQRARFDRQNSIRQSTGAEQVRMDEPLLAALEQGLPDCAGVAVGLDRLLMAITDSDTISDVMTFTSA